MGVHGGMHVTRAELDLVQLDLPREEEPAAEATRLTDIRELSVASPCMGAGGCQRAWANSV